MTFLNFYSTFRDKKEAQDIGSILLKEGLIACYNIFPIESSFFWEGKQEKQNEYAGFFKTTLKNEEALEKRIQELHSYEIPCIMHFKVDANKSYTDWINNSTQ